MDPEQVLSLRLLRTELYNDPEKSLVRDLENAGQIFNTISVRSFPCKAKTTVRDFLCGKDKEMPSWVPHFAERVHWEGRYQVKDPNAPKTVARNVFPNCLPAELLHNIIDMLPSYSVQALRITFRELYHFVGEATGTQQLHVVTARRKGEEDFSRMYVWDSKRQEACEIDCPMMNPR
ncbi:hypothetical protein W97_06549 [Coniosporium apollinis CBS 100218]|uniref:F-box domain-containing protein n=1 Tax=Coniosporium apollinis (strain CBS 100218) TaxID=1168221 RepID=R7Z051_CONA1|nr:uncharacterized protein W97_06549 [Coniosporium apollinis CBS 100218]EON67296.1 hypothetical protein W97_06549 [Coniosporium apollinis CBS 100218]